MPLTPEQLKAWKAFSDWSVELVDHLDAISARLDEAANTAAIALAHSQKHDGKSSEVNRILKLIGLAEEQCTELIAEMTADWSQEEET